MKVIADDYSDTVVKEAKCSKCVRVEILDDDAGPGI